MIYIQNFSYCLSFVFCSCAKMPREKQLKGEGVYVAHSSKLQSIIDRKLKGAEPWSNCLTTLYPHPCGEHWTNVTLPVLRLFLPFPQSRAWPMNWCHSHSGFTFPPQLAWLRNPSHEILIPALRRWKCGDLHKFKNNLLWIVGSRSASTSEWQCILKEKVCMHVHFICAHMCICQRHAYRPAQSRQFLTETRFRIECQDDS